MNIFPEENELEIRHRHIAVDCLILGRLLVEIALMLPISLVERRNDARDRVPTRNRQARFGQARNRSEEHTSELQSLMRISSAVFCLQKKKKQTKKRKAN